MSKTNANDFVYVCIFGVWGIIYFFLAILALVFANKHRKLVNFSYFGVLSLLYFLVLIADLNNYFDIFCFSLISLISFNLLYFINLFFNKNDLKIILFMFVLSFQFGLFIINKDIIFLLSILSCIYAIASILLNKKYYDLLKININFKDNDIKLYKFNLAIANISIIVMKLINSNWKFKPFKKFIDYIYFSDMELFKKDTMENLPFTKLIFEFFSIIQKGLLLSLELSLFFFLIYILIKITGIILMRIINKQNNSNNDINGTKN